MELLGYEHDTLGRWAGFILVHEEHEWHKEAGVALDRSMEEVDAES